MKKIIVAFTFLFGTMTLFAQTEDELKAKLATTKDSIATIQGRANAIQAQIDALPGWKIGAFGTVGGSLSGFNNWFTQASPNNSSGNIGLSFNGYANLQQEKFFWYTAL